MNLIFGRFGQSRRLCATLLSFSLVIAARAQVKGDRETFSDCQKRASSQRELQVCAEQEFKRADAALNSSYQRLLRKAKCDAVSEKKIRAAQRSWLAFRDAQLEATYPHEDKQGEYGTAYPMCALLLKTELTKERTKMLKKMLNPVEGEVCDAGLRYSSCAPQTSESRPVQKLTTPPHS